MTWPLLDRIVSRLLPPVVAGEDRATQRQARMVVLFALACFVCGPLYGVIYVLVGMPSSAIGAMIGTAAFGLTLIVLRCTGSATRAAHFATLGLYLAIAFCTLPTGGIAAPAIAAFALVPVIARMLGDRRAGALWTGICLLTLGGYYLLDATGRTPTSEIPPGWSSSVRFAANTGLLILVAILVALYETTKDRTLGDLAEAHRAVVRAHDEARAAHAAARLVLDHVAEGLVVADRNGMMARERSNALATIVGSPEAAPAAAAAPVWSLFVEKNPTLAEILQLGWEEVFDGPLPREVALAQLPRECRLDDKTLTLAYVPLTSRDGQLEQILLVVNDVSENVRVRELERKQHEQLDVFRWLVKDTRYFEGFLRDTEYAITNIEHGELTSVEVLRALHTIKGNASLFGLRSLAGRCHAIEEAIAEEGGVLTATHRTDLASAFRETKERIAPLLDERTDGDHLRVPRTAYSELLRSLPSGNLRQRVLEWSWEPTRAHLDRLAAQARALATRLFGRDLDVVVMSDETRIAPGQWAAFWSAAAHLVRNALDHGIEPEEERSLLGKPASGKLVLRARASERWLIVEFIDDGRGIDWARIEDRARSLGLPVRDRKDLESALFADGLSTRTTVTELSGRGVGMAAVKEACRALDATIEIESIRGKGTTFRFALPLGRPGGSRPDLRLVRGGSGR